MDPMRPICGICKSSPHASGCPRGRLADLEQDIRWARMSRERSDDPAARARELKTIRRLKATRDEVRAELDTYAEPA